MYKLLVVEDEKEIRNGLSKYFPWSKIGFECMGSVENGHEALDFLRSTYVNVVLSDIMMPIMSGIDLARNISSLGRDTKVIFLSGYKSFEYAQQAFKYGVINYITKPVNYDEVIEVFTKVKRELDILTPDINNVRNSENLVNNDKSFNVEKKIFAVIKDYISNNIKDVTLEDIADLIHMHPFYVSKIFKKNIGQTFSDFVMKMRMVKSSELLMNIDLKTYEISEMVGYNNSKNFTRAFKSYFGMNPREYREVNKIK